MKFILYIFAAIILAPSASAQLVSTICNEPSTGFVITSSAGSNGSISPSGATTVTSGANQAYTITPSACYLVNQVTVDGSSVGAVSTYTFTSVSATHTISVSFSQQLEWSTSLHGASAGISGTCNNTYTNSTGTTNCGLGTVGQSSGDHLFEVYLTYTGVLTLVGVGNSSSNTGNYAGSDANAWVYDTYGTGYMYHNGSGTPISGCSGNTGMYVEVEYNAGSLYIYLAGTSCTGGAIATGITGTVYPIMGYLNDAAIINYDATNFHNPVSGKNTSAYSWR